MRVKTETMVQKEDGTRIYKPRTIQEVFNDIKKILTEEGLCPEEYFTLSYPTGCHADEPFLRFPVCSVMRSGVEVKEFIWILL